MSAGLLALLGAGLESYHGLADASSIDIDQADCQDAHREESMPPEYMGNVAQKLPSLAVGTNGTETTAWTKGPDTTSASSALVLREVDAPHRRSIPAGAETSSSDSSSRHRKCLPWRQVLRRRRPAPYESDMCADMALAAAKDVLSARSGVVVLERPGKVNMRMDVPRGRGVLSVVVKVSVKPRQRGCVVDVKCRLIDMVRLRTTDWSRFAVGVQDDIATWENGSPSRSRTPGVGPRT